MINLGSQGPSTFDTGTVAVPDTATWDLITILQCGGTCSGILLDVSVGAGGALGGFKLTRASTVGGIHRDYMVNTDFNTATAEITSVITTTGGTPNLNSLAASAAAGIKLARQEGVGEIGIWAMAASTPTTVRVTGTNVASQV